MSKRLLTITALCLAALATWVAAPALSLQPYSPKPVDFQQKLPGLESVSALGKTSALRAAAAGPTTNDDVSADGAVRWVSRAIEAPKPFDAVGVKGERRELEYRTKRGDGAWSNWVVTGNGDPVLANAATALQVRSRGFRPKGSLYYVNVSGTDSTGHRLLSAARGAVHSAFVSVAATPIAGAAATRPSIIGRSQWDPNNNCKPRRSASLGKVKAGVVHHTVNTNSYSKGSVKGMILGICRFHRNSNGWDDIGYNALSDRFGRLYVGRAGGIDRAVIGAHAHGFNSETTSISSLGDHRSKTIGSSERPAIERFLAWKLFTVHHVHPNSTTTLTSRATNNSLSRYPKGAKVSVPRVTYHSKLGKTECPGGAARGQVTTIRRNAEARI